MPLFNVVALTRMSLTCSFDVKGQADIGSEIRYSQWQGQEAKRTYLHRIFVRPLLVVVVADILDDLGLHFRGLVSDKLGALDDLTLLHGDGERSKAGEKNRG
jgi:hypothetical protein